MSNATALALNIDRLMRRIHADLQPRAESFDIHNVGPLGGMLILTLGEIEPVESKKLVETLGRDKSQISRLIQKFENKGLIAREKGSLDRRVSFLTLTTTGQEQLDRIKEVLSLIVDDLFSSVSDDERATLNAIISKVLISSRQA